MMKLTLTYAAADERTALRLAKDLEKNGYTFGDIGSDTVLIAVMSPDAVADNDVEKTLNTAIYMGAHIILVETAPTELPAKLQNLKPISFDNDYRLRDVIDAIHAAGGEKPMVVLTPALRRRNLRFGLIFGGGILLLFALYTVAIAIFDIEAPIEDFERLYTRDAATINSFAQEYIPLNTEQAANFKTTVEGINRELATIVVATATQAAADGGFTPQPTGQIIITEELSEVRQLATSGAIDRERQTQQASLSDEDIAATATQAAATANAELDAQNQTVTAAAQE